MAASVILCRLFFHVFHAISLNELYGLENSHFILRLLFSFFSNRNNRHASL